ncbi:methyltransferase domain protein [Synechococcus sp. BOUM118]|nr:methyltransferase domain protein [Synechococcus sp. BOUM118]
MWKNYFGHGSKVIGIDINPECKKHESEGIEIFIGSQDDPNLLNEIKSKYPIIDILLDDGSHMMSHMKKTFAEMYSFIDNNGIYLIEDTHTCYWKEYEGGVREKNSFMELSKDLIDHLNAVHTRGVIQPSAFTKSTGSICFYDSVIVFEKSPQGERQAPITKGM